jgi:MFS family permease
MWYHLSVFYSEAEMGVAYAKVASCTAVAQVVGAPIAAGILALDGMGGLRGWQWLFILEGSVTVIFGCVLRFMLAPSPAKAPMLTRVEREWLHERQETARAALAAPGRASAVSSREGGSGTATSLLQQVKGTLSE